MKNQMGIEKMKVLFGVLLLLGGGQMARAEESSTQEVPLEDQLQGLSLPSNQAPAGVSSEKLYSVQTRYSPLRMTHEFGLGVGKNFTSDSSIDSTHMDFNYRFHISDRWGVNLGGAYVFNSLNSGAQRILDNEGILLDSTYTKYRAQVLAEYNVFYGKFRLSMDTVLYFDQYIALGPGLVVQQFATSPAGVADVGFVFWLGKWGSLRVGVRDYLHQEKRRLSTSLANDLVGHIDLGVMLGG